MGRFVKQGKNIENRCKMFENIGLIFIYSCQQDQLYLDENNQFIGDQDHVKECFDLAVKAYQEGLIYGVDNWTPEWNAAIIMEILLLMGRCG